MQQYSDLQESIESSAEAAPAQDQSAQPPEPENIASTQDAPITPTIKDAIDEEVRQQLAIASAAASSQADPKSGDLPAALQLDHVFVVSSLLEVDARDDQTCNLSVGDVLQLAVPPDANEKSAKARVASSHRADCPTGEIVAVSLQDLQQMQNDLRAEMDEGLRQLHDNQGKAGWPQAPASALAEPPRPAIDGLPPQADVSTLFEEQKTEVANAEATATNLAAAN
jgi:hypothetical protein